MNNLYIIVLLCLCFSKVCVTIIWHSYQFDPMYQSREELVITNITASENFKFDYIVKKWKSVQVDNTYYLSGIMEKNVAVIHVKLNDKNEFSCQASVIELDANVVDVVIFQHWNSSSQNTDVIIVVATAKPELLWYRVDGTNNTLFWSWPMSKTISHINVFQIDYEYHLLIINEYLGHVTADLFLCELKNSPNFWLRQKLELSNIVASSAAVSTGPNNFLAIPQESINTLLIYKLNDGRFVPYKNVTSRGVTEVVSFKVGHKFFLAINGLNAGIFKFTKRDVVKESLVDSQLDGVNYWLPIPLIVYGDDTILMAQRSLDHSPHKSFVIEVITYNGDKFEEHEDIPCFYFGEDGLGLSCLPDEERGVTGATSIFLDGILGLLVPRKSRSSELFLVGTELRIIPNPVKEQIDDIIEKKNYINNLIEDQEHNYNKLSSKLRDPIDIVALKSQLDEIDGDIKAIQENSGTTDDFPHYDTIVFNGFVKIEADAEFGEVNISEINGEPATPTFEDIVLKNNVSSIASPKVFNDLEAEDLVVERANGVSSPDLLFSSNNMTISGNLFLVNPLTVLENMSTSEVNGFTFHDDHVFENFEKVELETLSVFTNIEVGSVNGEDFNTFLSQLCLKNIENTIFGNIKTNGNVTIEEDAEIGYLNELKFPLDYVLVDNSFPNITGFKHFNNILSISEVQSEGIVDGIDTSRIITLSTTQNVTATTTFKNLKITESLNVDGDIIGEHASKFLPNPTLLETNSVKAIVHFKNLKVNGAIILTENFNGRHFESILNDVVYDTESRPVIEALKQFPEALTVRENLLITSNIVNNVALDTIVTKNGDQVLNVTTIVGIVTFENVECESLYDSVDINKLDEDVVRLDGEQYISSTLIFEDPVAVNKLSLFGNITFLSNSSLVTDSVEIENIDVDGNLYVNIANFDLEKFDASRMSHMRNQLIDANFTLHRTSAQDLTPLTINNVDPYDYTYDGIQRKMATKLIKGNLSVTNFHVNFIEVNKINNRMAIGLGGSLWKHDVKKHNITNLVFNNDVYFDELKIEKLSGVNFNRFLDNVIFKNETDVKLTGRKTFLKGCTIKKLVETQKLNNIKLSDILSKHGNQKILGSITIHGNVSVQNNVTVSENINDIPVTTITDMYKSLDGQAEIKGDILFNRLAHIHSLDIEGYVGDKLVQDVMDGLVYTNVDVKLEGQTTFENSVNIEKNIKVTGKINNVDLPALVSDMVMVTKDTTIISPVKFSEPVFVENGITLHGDLKTGTLNDIKLETWIDNAVFIDNGYLKGTYMFENVKVVDNLHTNYINNINMKTLIPLRSQQNLSKLIFNEISLFKDVSVGNSTNYCNLHDEFTNSVMSNTDEDIDSHVEFQGNVFIEGDVELIGSLNDFDTNQIVTTNTDQELSAVYNFKTKATIDENLIVEGLVNGIDIDKWVREGVKTQGAQNITDDWSTDQLIFEEDAIGNGLINGINFQKFGQEIEEKRHYKYQIEKAFIDDYTNICKDLTYMYDKLKNQIYKFSYLENFQVLNFQNKLEYVYSFKYNNNNYLLVNERKSCETYLFIYEHRFRYVKNLHFGQIAQIISVHYNDLLYLVIRNQPFYSTCKVQGTNLWQLLDNDFVHLANVEDQDLLQDSLIPGTFYGISEYIVTEFRILPNSDLVLRRYRKWEVKEENMAFVPRGFATGLALTTGRKLLRLHRDIPANDDFNYETENIIRGNYSEEFNTYFLGRKDSDFVVMKVGIRSTKRSLLAVASHEETSVKGSLDFITIYEDVITGKVFHKVPTYKPSSLITLEFDNGETLLAFMEDESVLQVYEYKGIEGFKSKLSAKLKGSKLFVMNLGREVIGVVDRNKISFVEAVMLGNQIVENLQCSNLEV